MSDPTSASKLYVLLVLLSLPHMLEAVRTTYRIHDKNTKLSPILQLLEVLEALRLDRVFSDEFQKNSRGFETILRDGTVFVTRIEDSFPMKANHSSSEFVKHSERDVPPQVEISMQRSRPAAQHLPKQNPTNGEQTSPAATRSLPIFNAPLGESPQKVTNRRKRSGKLSLLMERLQEIQRMKRGNRARRSFYHRNMYIYRHGDRKAVNSYELRMYPYSNIVRLSSGCSGTLITPLHVLTAAHCVHDGNDFRNKLEMMKVEVPETVGYRLYYIQKISVPIAWLRSTHITELGRSVYDYAVIRLSIPVSTRRKFMKLSMLTSQALYDKTYFLGYPEDDTSQLWKSSCSTRSNVVFMGGNLMLSQCDSVPGNSGSAVYTTDGDEESIIGVLSNSVSAAMPRQLSYYTRARYSIITTFTFQKLLDICNMMGKESDFLDMCEKLKKMAKHRFLSGSERVLPFFG